MNPDLTWLPQTRHALHFREACTVGRPPLCARPTPPETAPRAITVGPRLPPPPLSLSFSLLRAHPTHPAFIIIKKVGSCELRCTLTGAPLPSRGVVAAMSRTHASAGGPPALLPPALHALLCCVYDRGNGMQRAQCVKVEARLLKKYSGLISKGFFLFFFPFV